MSADNMHPVPLGDALTERLIPEHDQTPVIVDHAHEVLAYTWDLSSDQMTWQPHAAEFLQLGDVPAPTDGAQFSALIVDEHVRRRDAVISLSRESDAGTGVPFEIRYRIAPEGARSKKHLALSESGRWWGGPDGKPTQARGVLRFSKAQLPGDYGRETGDYDELTGQLSRMRLNDALDVVLNRANQMGSTAAFLMVAVNNLQRFNDSFGYETGDQVLAEVGRRLRREIRAGDTLGRYSANKFGIILPGCTVDELDVASQRILRNVSATPIETDRCNLTTSVSIGAVMLPDHAANADTCFGRVLRALDEARFNSRHAFSIYKPDGGQDLRRLRSARIADYIDSALREDRLELALQPIVSATGDRAPALYECLLRIKNPTEEVFSPSDFIPIAEELGLAGLIDARTLVLATDLLKEHRWLRLSLNVSALTCNDASWLRSLTHIVGRNPDIAKRLVVEITETMAATDIDEAAHFVDAVRELGCRVAIDDFGAGYTSFANLKRLPADILKIEGSFVRNLMNDRSDQVFVRTMVEIAESFGMETVAEWVGDAETADYVERLGVTYIQGFHFGEPQPVEEIVRKHRAGLARASRTARSAS